jgi:hypothetical protein
VVPADAKILSRERASIRFLSAPGANVGFQVQRFAAGPANLRLSRTQLCTPNARTTTSIRTPVVRTPNLPTALLRAFGLRTFPLPTFGRAPGAMLSGGICDYYRGGNANLPTPTVPTPNDATPNAHTPCERPYSQHRESERSFLGCINVPIKVRLRVRTGVLSLTTPSPLTTRLWSRLNSFALNLACLGVFCEGSYASVQSFGVPLVRAPPPPRAGGVPCKCLVSQRCEHFFMRTFCKNRMSAPLCPNVRRMGTT